MLTMLTHPQTGEPLQVKLGGGRDYGDLLVFEGTYRFLFQAEEATLAPAYFDLDDGFWLRVEEGSLSLVPAREGMRLPIRDSYGFVLADEWASTLDQCLHSLHNHLVEGRCDPPLEARDVMSWSFPGHDIKREGATFTLNGQTLGVSDTKSLTSTLLMFLFME